MTGEAFMVSLGLLAFVYFPLVFWDERQRANLRDRQKREAVARAVEKIRRGSW